MSLNTTQNQENVVSQNNNDTQNTDDNKTQEETIKDESKDSEDEMISNVVEISENTAKSKHRINNRWINNFRMYRISSIYEIN